MHQTSRTRIPIRSQPWISDENSPSIGIIKQATKNTPLIIKSHFNILSKVFWGLIVKPIKKVDSAIIPYPSKL